MTSFWPLMENTIGNKEKTALVEFIRKSDRFTNGEQVLDFETKWSDWQGCKHSLFVNSGSSANMLLLWAMKTKYFQDKEMVVLTPACTWATNISSMIQFGIDFVVADNDLFNFGISEKALIEAKKISKKENKDINVILITHLLGSPSDINLIKKHFPKAQIIEDCCESHGATYEGKKVGNMGKASTFSFYYGHHMTTIEGGMICTDDDELYNIMRMMRSHGLSSESLDIEYKTQLNNNNPDIDSRFLFPYTGFNFRNTEINAVLGKVQLESLNDFITIRKNNLLIFDKILQENSNILNRFNLEGNSAMVLPFLCKNKKIKNMLMKIFEKNGIETRPFLIGNLLNQPFMPLTHISQTPTKNSDYLDECGFYIGNNQNIGAEKLHKLKKIIKLIYGELYDESLFTSPAK